MQPLRNSVQGSIWARIRVDLDAVAFGELGVGGLHLGIASAGAHDGALGVVDDDARGHAVEPLERPAVSGQPAPVSYTHLTLPTS